MDQRLVVLGRADYVLLSTFKRDGSRIPTPVWTVLIGDELRVWTNPTSGKVKRIRRDGRVEVAPCSQRGTPRGRSIPAHARILDDDEVRETLDVLLAKYGLLARLTQIPDKLGGVLGRPRRPTGGIGIRLPN